MGIWYVLQVTNLNYEREVTETLVVALVLLFYLTNNLVLEAALTNL